MQNCMDTSRIQVTYITSSWVIIVSTYVLSMSKLLSVNSDNALRKQSGFGQLNM